MAAGQTLTISAANIQNLNATLAAQGDITLNATSNVTNRSGAIQSLTGDVSITAPTLVNTTMDPARLHKSYGGQNPPYAGGCNPGGTYGNSQCAADEDAAAGPAGVISAARDVQLSGTNLTNKGALITGGRNVTVGMAGSIDNNSIPLNADWVGRWQEDHSGGDRWHDTGGRATLGSLESGIQASNALSVKAGGQVLNTGNLMGSQVDVTGAALVNGYTSPTQPTPPATGAQQVIPLGPVATPGGAVPAATPVNNPTTPWQFNPVIVATPAAPTTGSSQTIDWHFNANLGGNPVTAPNGTTDRAQYLNNSPATAVLAGVTPDSLLAQLPAELRPGKVSFYYDPYTEGQRLQQAALQQTGQASFVSGLAWDSQNQLSVTDQEKLSLYKNAADYAKAHNIALGTALTQTQVNELDKPLLWYVQQAVPDPNCNTVASTACPTVNALVPQVYLPEGYAQALTKPTGGTIAGDKVSLDIAGQLRNSGAITAADTLNVKAGSIDAGPNVVDIGTSAYKAQGGWNVITGTVVQPGGFMSAMRMNIEADSIHAVNNAFLIRNADGTVDEAATVALVNQLKANLGLNYTEGTVADDIHTQFIQEKKGFGPLGQIVMMVAAVAISIVTAGAAAAVMGVALAQMTLAQAMIVAALSSMASSAFTQLASGQGLNFGKLATAGAIGAITAGLTKGITFDGSSFGVSEWGKSLEGTNTLANLAGTNSVGGVVQAAQNGATGTLAQQAVGFVGTGLINAGVSTVFNGGSFGNALKGSLVAQGAALGANSIGANTDPGSFENIASHAALGCVAGVAGSGDCASGAIGGATGAVISPLVGSALGIETNADRANSLNQAVVIGAAMLAGGALANALGQNGVSAAAAAQNEAANNYLSAKQEKGLVDALNACATGDTACVAKWTSYYTGTNAEQQQAARNCALDGCTAISNEARSAPSINSDANLAACQGVASCISLLNSLPSQNSSAAAAALQRWNDTKNARVQDVTQKAALASGVSPTTAAALSSVSPIEVSGAIDGALGAAIGAIANRGANANTSSGSSSMINGVTVVDQRTGTVYQGTVDLQPTLTRIANGGAPLSKNDGTVFQNRPVNGTQLLPAQPAGYYKEYVVPTKGITGPGPQRIVMGKGGEVYYTPDHYQTFIPVKN